jgi:hypothetical protein
MLDRLTIYRIQFQDHDAGVLRLVDLGQRIFELKDNFQLSETNNSRVLRSGPRTVEVATASGGVWAADEAQLWNPSIRPNLLKEADALAKANDIVRTRKLLPDL